MAGLSQIDYDVAFSSEVLGRQRWHRSEKIWKGDDNYEVGTVLATLWKPDAQILPFLEEAGFGCIPKLPKVVTDRALCTALVERWRRETHTFHLPVGEMTVTLQDVAMILGLRIDGEPVICNDDFIDLHTECMRLLGRSPVPIVDGIPVLRGTKNVLPLSWLKENFGDARPTVNADPETLRQFTRGYILYVIGGYLLPTAKKTEVSALYLRFLGNFNDTSTYSWGSAVLAHLYSALCHCAETVSTTYFSGCVPLLQIWCWEHLHLRPTVRRVDPLLLANAPVSACWSGPKSWKSISVNVLPFFRDELDQLEQRQVNWTPYGASRLGNVAGICMEGVDIYLSVVPLIHFAKVEWYRPDRVLRQFGYVQHIPQAIRENDDATHETTNRRGAAHEPWEVRQVNYIQLWENRLQNVLDINELELSNTPTTGDGYFEWYNSNTWKLVGRPKPKSESTEVDQGYIPRGCELQKMIDGTIRGCELAFSDDATVDGWRDYMVEMMGHAGQSQLCENIRNTYISNMSPGYSPPDDTQPETSSRQLRRRRRN